MRKQKKSVNLIELKQVTTLKLSLDCSVLRSLGRRNLHKYRYTNISNVYVYVQNKNLLYNYEIFFGSEGLIWMEKYSTSPQVFPVFVKHSLRKSEVKIIRYTLLAFKITAYISLYLIITFWNLLG